jgi:signal transduction histidine kinase
LETTIEINILSFVLLGVGLMLIFVIAFIALFLVFKKRIEREQEALRTVEINFERRINEASLKAEQQERAQIAMDLHDEIGALVSVLKLNILNAKGRLDNPESLFSLLTDTSVLIEKTAETIRGISNRISPPILVKMGIHPALLELIKTINATGKMYIDYPSNFNGIRFPVESELNIYRIIKETINNVLKHGNTDKLNLDIQIECNHLKINFEYYGIGINNSQVQRLLRHAKGNGLKSIQSRINNLNATINYEVTKKGKAEINIKIPIDEISN